MQYRHKRYARSFARSFLSFVFSRCGRFISRKIIPFSLCFVVLCLSLAVPSFAADEGTDDMDTAELLYYSTYVYEGDLQPLPVTRTFANWQNRSCYRYNLPSTEGTFKGVTVYGVKNFVGNHEYNLKLYFGAGYANQVFDIQLAFYDGNGNQISYQPLYHLGGSNFSGSTWYDVDINFKADTSAITSGYSVRLEFIYTSNTTAGMNYYLSDEIYLNDNDDDTGLLHSIIEWLRDIRDKLVNGFSNLTTSISGFFTDLKNNLVNKLQSVQTAITDAIDGIEQWFIDLKDNLVDGLKSLFIPRDGYFAQKKQELETWCTAHFGALYQGPDVMLNLIRKLLTINPQQPSITMPAIQFKWNGETVTLQESITYSFAWVNDSSHPVYYFYHIYKGFVTVILFVAFGNYLVNKYKNVFEGEGDPE